MNKWIMVGIILIAFATISIAVEGGIAGSKVTTADLDIQYPAEKGDNQYSKDDMLIFDGISYEVYGNKIILNKENVFQNREILFSLDQTCLEYSVPACTGYEIRAPIECKEMGEKETCNIWVAPADCIEFDDKAGVCKKYDAELKCNSYGESTCSKYSTVDRNYIIQQAIKREIEFVKGVQDNRSNSFKDEKTDDGKVLIK
jgi:hypothetical protein